MADWNLRGFVKREVARIEDDMRRNGGGTTYGSVHVSACLVFVSRLEDGHYDDKVRLVSDDAEASP